MDGRLLTFQSMQERQSKLKQWSAQRGQRLAEAVEVLVSLEDAPRLPASPLVAGTPKSDEKEMPASSVPSCSSLKKASVCAEPSEKIKVPVEDPSSNLQALGLEEFMAGTLTGTLKDLKTKMRGIKELLLQVEDRPTLSNRPVPLPPGLPPQLHLLEWNVLTGDTLRAKSSMKHWETFLPEPKLLASCFLEPLEPWPRSSGIAIRPWSLSKLARSPSPGKR